MLLGEGEDTQDSPYSRHAIRAMDLLAEGADVGAGTVGTKQQRLGAARSTAGLIFFGDAMETAASPEVFSEELAGLGIQEAYVQAIPAHQDFPADPAGRCTVVGGVDLDAAIEVHG